MSAELVCVTWQGLQMVGKLVSETEEILTVTHLASIVKDAEMQSQLAPEPLPYDLLGDDISKMVHSINKKALICISKVDAEADLMLCKLFKSFWEVSED